MNFLRANLKQLNLKIFLKSYGLIFLLASLFFAVSIGFHILPLSSINWMLVYEDPSNHLLGWIFFQGSEWTWPLGQIPKLLSPTGAAVGKTDSIPLFAYIFKLFKEWLPYPSQYFGFALYLSYLGLAFSSYSYIQKRTEASFWKIAIAVAIVLCSPVFWSRLTNQTPHIALTFHFVIIAVLSLWNVQSEKALNWRKIFWFNLGVALTSLIHPLLWIVLSSIHFPLSFVFGYRQKKIKAVALGTILSLILSLILLQTSGVLGGEGELGAWGFGIYSANLLTFFDPNELSRFFPDLVTPNGQAEGMGYLGLGVIFLLFIQVLIFFKRKIKSEITFSPSAGIWICAIVLGFVSLSSKIYIANNLIIDLSNFYEFFGFLTGPLRSSGRLIWPLYYLILLTLISTFLKGKSVNSIVFLLAALVLQVFDVFPFEKTPLQTWTQLPLKNLTSVQDFKDIQLIRFFPPVVGIEKNITECIAGPPVHYPDYVSLALSAANLNISINSGLASRFPWQAVEKECIEIKKIVLGLAPEIQKSLYIFNSQIEVPKGVLECSTRESFQLCRIKSKNP